MSDDIIQLTPIKRHTIDVPIIGVTPVIPHRWSEKARNMMRAKQTGSKARAKHDPKDATAEAEAALYRLADGRPGLPAAAFRAATIGAARFYEGVTMTSLKAALFVVADDDEEALVAIEGEMKLREDTPRNSGGTADLRYRYAFWPWSAVLRIEYIPSMIDAESVINLVDAGGSGGVGDWRPSAPKSMTGAFGRYEVKL
ncbi:hypothetical protein [Mycobacterium szulgai]|uniref:hypothetical protein n=1 Tax=Mycobacterium szulgai TaxID=1787 RepID=UPI00111BE688|nr:hypothetical protein [Mycobacterium szulgai]MCV7076713.1 hypothetical protein [Mycobacterium szulgai]